MKPLEGREGEERRREVGGACHQPLDFFSLSLTLFVSLALTDF